MTPPPPPTNITIVITLNDDESGVNQMDGTVTTATTLLPVR